MKLSAGNGHGPCYSWYNKTFERMGEKMFTADMKYTHYTCRSTSWLRHFFKLCVCLWEINNLIDQLKLIFC